MVGLAFEFAGSFLILLADEVRGGSVRVKRDVDEIAGEVRQAWKAGSSEPTERPGEESGDGPFCDLCGKEATSSPPPRCDACFLKPEPTPMPPLIPDEAIAMTVPPPVPMPRNLEIPCGPNPGPGIPHVLMRR